MNKLKFALIALNCLFWSGAFAQNPEEEAIKRTINQLFEGMRKADSTLVLNAFNDGAILQTIVKNKGGNTIVKSTNLNLFATSIAKPHPKIYDERIVFTKILIDDNLASVWTSEGKKSVIKNLTKTPFINYIFC